MSLATDGFDNPSRDPRRSLPSEGQRTVRRSENAEALDELSVQSRGRRFNPLSPRILLLALIGASLTRPTNAITCNAACATCFGSLITQCTTCAAGYIQQSYKCVTTATGCSAGFKLDTTTNICMPWLCALNCDTCWDDQPTSCTSCVSGYVLQDNQCLPYNAAQTAGNQFGCAATYQLDSNDNACKHTIYDIDTPCIPGTVNKQEGASSVAQCLACGAGLFCESFANAVGGSACNAGHYCQANSNTRSPKKEYDSYRPATGNYPTPTANPSPPPVTVNYFQGYDMTVPATPVVINDICQPGGYSAAGQRSCTSCPAGMFCPREWMQDQTYAGPCRAGFYCVSGVTKPTPNNPLPTSTSPSFYAAPYFQDSLIKLTPTTAALNGGKMIEVLETTSQGNICPVGRYCTAGVSVPVQCDPGFFLPYLGATISSACLPCPAGLYCPTSGFADPYNSPGTPAGTYAIANGQYNLLFRTTSTTYYCSAGFFCSSGSSVAQATACLQDYYCPAGTNTMIPCPPNQYTTGMRSSSCLTCPAGSNCVGLGAAISCSLNQWCVNSIVSYCPVGQNSGTSTGNTAQSACLPCPNAYYCQQPTVLVPCADGFYCFADATAGGYGGRTPKPNNPVSYSANVNGQNGGICYPGQFCKASVSSTGPITCTAGQYCSNYANADTEGPCREGYYCAAGSSFPIGQFDGSNFQMTICPAGNFCPTGSSTPQPCPIGTYSFSLGAAQSSDCKPCPASVICNSLGVAVLPMNTAFAATCGAGVYCPVGASATDLAANQYDCSRGYRCPSAVNTDPTYDATIVNIGQMMILCEAGQYQDLVKQSTCKPCDAGFYCDYEDPTSEKSCPGGFYCPAGTKVANEYPCPQGSYSVSIGATAASTCTTCDCGFYCSLTGQQTPTGKLVARYHANGQPGQSVPNPHLCPTGAYCPDGSCDSISCADGQWTSDIGMQSQTECIPCPRGKFCKFLTMRSDVNWQAFKLVNPSYSLTDLLAFGWFANFYGNCQAGYICKEGSKTATPADEVSDNGYPCPIGHFCAPGFLTEKPCLPGTYNDQTQQGACFPCPAGEYCPNFAMTAGIQCTSGSYCPQGSIYPNPCPAGTFVPKIGGLNQVGLASAAACTPCTAGSYCENLGDTMVTGDCAPGFVCGPGMDRAGPYATIHNPMIPASTGRCPAGSYCTQGSLQGLGCPNGQYQDNRQQSTCIPAPPGKYCVAGVCADCDYGYYCSGGAFSKNPTKPGSTPYDNHGGLCPAQSYCSQGFGAARPCDAGSWQPLTGQWTCDPCPIGNLCTGGGNMQPCPAFNVCTGSTTFIFGQLCPNGFYGNAAVTGYNSTLNCTACTAEHFCTAGRITGQCAAGYICNKQADSPTPNSLALKSSGLAYPCPAGYWCQQGAQEPNPCPLGFFTQAAGGRQVADCTICQIGFYCDQDSQTPTPCPNGHYCPIGSYEPIACPVGSYNPNTNGGKITDCLPCKGGYTCPSKGLGNIQQAGAQYKCKLGSYCPAGYNNQPIPCIDGSFYDNNTASANNTNFGNVYSGTTSLAVSIKDCQICPEHFYCPQGTGNRYAYPCPSGNICPPGSGAPTLCPPGYYCRFVNGAVQKNTCPVGYYCPIGTDTPHRCQPGTVCAIGSSSETQRGMTPADCKPGQYLNVDTCFACEPGFVCDFQTSQKYPIKSNEEGGYECLPGHYCPSGTTTATIKACPIGTFNPNKRGKSIADCIKCPAGSANSKIGQSVCLLCGSGSTNNADSTTCQCIGAYRTWQESSNQCVCQPGYQDPVITQADQTTSINLDCMPMVKPQCSPTQFVNSNNQCVDKSTCKSASLCGGQGATLGTYDGNLNQCSCKAKTSDPAAFCDQTCQKNVLKAFYTTNKQDPSKNQIILKAGSKTASFPFSQFENDVFLDGLYCPTAMCEITSTQSVNGTQAASAEADPVFVKAWRQYVDSNYKSPYGTRRLSAEADEAALNPQVSPRIRDALRNLQAAELMNQSIQCIKQYDAVSFSLQAPDHFPVYIKDSLYNSDPNFDSGAFTKLQNKMLYSQLNMKTFPYTFKELGSFAFGDYLQPEVVTTLVYVVSDVTEKCSGTKQWPLTHDNVKKLGIYVDTKKLVSYDKFLDALPVLAFAAVVILTYIQHRVEMKIEEREFEARAKRENMVKLKHYFKKKEDRFDKVAYLGDMYKVMQEYLDRINGLIADNERAVREEDAANVRRMLKDKYSVYDKLDKEGKIKQIAELKEDVTDMLENLRTRDGRTLKDLYEQMKLKKQLAQDEERLKALHDKTTKDEIERDSINDEPQEPEDIATTENKQESEEEDEQKEDEDMLAFQGIDPNQADDWRRIREEINKKKKDFAEAMDPNLDNKEQNAMLRLHAEQMQDLERDLRKEKENQDLQLKMKQKNRDRRDKKAMKEVNKREQDKTDEIAAAQELLHDLSSRKEQLEINGIKTKELKYERENEFQTKMNDLEAERAKTLTDMRNEYLERIRNSKDPREKEMLLEEMGQRMAQVEAARADELKKQEQMLKKMLKGRQKKTIRTEIKEIDKQMEAIEQNIERIRQDVDEDKAKAYADEGMAGLLVDEIKTKKDKLFDKLPANLLGFNNQLSDLEKDDIKIQNARLAMEKEKEMRSAETQIDERIDQEALYKLQELEKEQARFRMELRNATDPMEQKRLISELEQIQKEILFETENEKRNLDRILEQKRLKRKQLLQLKKMEIEQKQMDEVNAKEIELNQKKFDEQMNKMDEVVNTELDKQVRSLMNHEGPNKEQGLILINEVEDDLLAKKLKILMSKEFFDLTKYLGTLQSQAGISHMMRVREIKMTFEKDKQELVDRGISGHELEVEVQKLAQQMETEQLISAEHMKREMAEKESELRERKEKEFAQEKRDIINLSAERKKQKIRDAMERYPDERNVQDVGNRLLKRISNTVTEEMADIEKDTQKQLEKARLKLIADDQETLMDLQVKMNEDMMKAEVELEEKMKERKQGILALKKQNLEDRIKMAQDELTDFQIKEMRAQLQREYEQLEQVIANEKEKQLRGMRAAMLERRIKKERKRKAEIAELRQKELRDASNTVTSKMEQALKNKVQFSMGLKEANVTDNVKKVDQLLAKLHKWEKEVAEVREDRGGEEGNIWNLQYTKEREDEEKARVAKIKEEERRRRQAQIDYTVRELLKRIARVEKISNKMKVQGKGTVALDLNMLVPAQTLF